MKGVWTSEEDAILLRDFEAGELYRDIAATLGKSKQAVGYRLNSLGLTRRPSCRGDDASRFWSQVEKKGADECWPWLGYRDKDGYGSFAIWPTRVTASRFAYTLADGSVPSGLCVRHSCDNPPCCNPAHLILGTIRDNNADKTRRGRDARGEKHGMAKYDLATVREIKRRLKSGDGQTRIARELGVNRATVHTIAVGKQWRSVAAA